MFDDSRIVFRSSSFNPCLCIYVLLFSGDGRPEVEPDIGPNRNATDRRYVNVDHGTRFAACQRSAFGYRGPNDFGPGHQPTLHWFGGIDASVRRPADRNSRGRSAVPRRRRRLEPDADFGGIFHCCGAAAWHEFGQHGLDVIRRTTAGSNGAQTRRRVIHS